MSNVIAESIAKSSCDCYTCEDKNLIEKGVPTNMSVYNCDFSSFDCKNNNIIFNDTMIPKEKHGCDVLNPQVYKDKVSPSFDTIIGEQSCNDYPCQEVYKNGMININSGKQVFQNDPRLYHAPTSSWLTLDQAPINGSVSLETLPINPYLDKYGQYYKSYSDINAGQIQYYIDKSVEEPFFRPNFVDSNIAFSSLYQDPMGSIKPQYKLKPIKCDDPTGPTRNNYSGSLSFIQDTTNQREDIMSKQMWRQNQQKYSSRYAK
tara:strand:+ start:96 stop:878 length:783 start_codon:yes stop_codon:yes gene_type:complete